MNEQLDAIKAQAEGGHLDVMVIAKADVLAMLAEVERLTARAEEAEALLAGSPADTLAWALDKREQELSEARREVDRLTGELARLRNGGKPEPTQEENDAAQERLRQMDVLHARHGNNTSTWPDYALEHYNRLQGAQNDYEAKYC